MDTLVVGATGATGRLLVQQLLADGHRVKVIVRSAERLPPLPEGVNRDRLTVKQANLIEVSPAELAELVRGCDAVVSCLGHNLTFKGLFGPPFRLVTQATRRLCEAIQTNAEPRPTKFILMNTTGCRNRELQERISWPQCAVVGLLRLLIPPHADNEAALAYLQSRRGSSTPSLEWVAVRPDSLVDEDAVTAYALHPSPTRSAIFNAGKTSRINVAHFMLQLIADDSLWSVWKNQTPVIYNECSPE